MDLMTNRGAKQYHFQHPVTAKPREILLGISFPFHELLTVHGIYKMHHKLSLIFPCLDFEQSKTHYPEVKPIDQVADLHFPSSFQRSNINQKWEPSDELWHDTKISRYTPGP